MKKITFLLFIFLLTDFTFSQCVNNSENPITPTTSTNDGFVQAITTTTVAGEFATIDGLLVGDDYEFTSKLISSSANDYITITDELDVEIAKGVSPLIINSIAVEIVRMHISLDATCITDDANHATTIQNLTAAPTACYMPENPHISYLSNSRIDFNWDISSSGGTPTGNDWEIGLPGFIQGTGNHLFTGSTLLPTTSDTSGDVLSDGTDYEFYLRTDCGVNGTSNWLGPFPFPTNANPPPTNDFCSGAISIIQETGKVNATQATPIVGTLIDTAGTDIVAEECNGGANARDDVWFSFLAQTTDVNITLEQLSFNGILTLYSDCNASGYLDCSDSNGGLAPRNEEIIYSGLIIGQTYYTRVYSQGFSFSSPGFNLKIWSTTVTVDNDGDGFSDAVDCDDTPGSGAAINPDATEICDGIDNDCDGLIDDDDPSVTGQTTYYVDADGDGYGDDTDAGTLFCADPGAGYSLTNDDCDDTIGTGDSVNPGAAEILNNGIDDDCDPLSIDDIVDWNNLQWPPTGAITAGGVHDVFAQVFESGVTEPLGQGAGIECWIGYNTSNVDPSTGSWTWIVAGYNVASEGSTGNNDEYFADIGSGIAADGTYYYASRFRLNGGTFTYGGILADGSSGSIWDGITYISGVLTVSPPLTVADFNMESLIVQPNPFIERVSIHLPLGFNNDAFEINLFDLNGRLIIKQSTSSINGIININNLNRLQQGPYFIKITNKNNSKTVIRQLIKY